MAKCRSWPGAIAASVAVTAASVVAWIILGFVLHEYFGLFPGLGGPCVPPDIFLWFIFLPLVVIFVMPISLFMFRPRDFGHGGVERDVPDGA